MLKQSILKLSENRTLQVAAQKYGLKFGAQHVVAGTNVDELVQTVKRLNAKNIACTVDHLGEFIFDQTAAKKAKDAILQLLHRIHHEQLNAHLSIKPSQLGLDISEAFCYENLNEILALAAQYGIFVNLDMENYTRLAPTLRIVDKLHTHYERIGTVIQAYLLDAPQIIEQYKHLRLRIVKGAYREHESVAHQESFIIDAQYIQLIEYHLQNGPFTSIATHDHKIIEHVLRFAKAQNIDPSKFEFQMLYGFRNDLQEKLATNYNFCSYVPYGDDWYGYFMRRLAERPQNIQLITKQVFTKRTTALLAISAVGSLLLLKKRK